ncbi:MAG TPA: hypothetical protein VHY56_01375 [Candidatus Binataceae bacterium]|nr:hypothetical protein [Candidatus Binataceae bacterium]
MANGDKLGDTKNQAQKQKVKEEKVKEIVRNADLKKFDPDLEEATHPSKPAPKPTHDK